MSQALQDMWRCERSQHPLSQFSYRTRCINQFISTLVPTSLSDLMNECSKIARFSAYKTLNTAQIEFPMEQSELESIDGLNRPKKLLTDPQKSQKNISKP
jgi:hypothetical protein